MNKFKDYLQKPATVTTATVIGSLVWLIMFLLPGTGAIKGLIFFFAIVGSISGIAYFIYMRSNELKEPGDDSISQFAWLIPAIILFSIALIPVWILSVIFSFAFASPGFFIFSIIMIVIVVLVIKKYGSKIEGEK